MPVKGMIKEALGRGYSVLKREDHAQSKHAQNTSKIGM